MTDPVFSVLRMPYKMAMGDEMSRARFYKRAQEATDRLKAANRRIAELEAKIASQKPPVNFSQRASKFEMIAKVVEPVEPTEPPPTSNTTTIFS